MNSKTKLLKKGKYIPGQEIPETTKEVVSGGVHEARNKKREAESRTRSRRMKNMMRKGLSKERILELFNSPNIRTIMFMYYGTYTTEDKDKNVLRGRKAVEKLLEDNNIEVITCSTHYYYIKTDVNSLDNVLKLLKPAGRSYTYTPEVATEEKLEKAKEFKMTKKPAKKENMRPYYAALRKGGVDKRIKKYNKTLADKIEKWLKEHKKLEAIRAEKSKEYRAKHRQLTSKEMKINKKARKAVKHLASIERRKQQENVKACNNAKLKAKRAQKAQKPIQTELKMAA